jgi:hypothetical protein
VYDRSLLDVPNSGSQTSLTSDRMGVISSDLISPSSSTTTTTTTTTATTSLSSSSTHSSSGLAGSSKEPLTIHASSPLIGEPHLASPPPAEASSSTSLAWSSSQSRSSGNMGSMTNMMSPNDSKGLPPRAPATPTSTSTSSTSSDTKVSQRVTGITARAPLSPLPSRTLSLVTPSTVTATATATASAVTNELSSVTESKRLTGAKSPTSVSGNRSKRSTPVSMRALVSSSVTTSAPSSPRPSSSSNVNFNSNAIVNSGNSGGVGRVNVVNGNGIASVIGMGLSTPSLILGQPSYGKSNPNSATAAPVSIDNAAAAPTNGLPSLIFESRFESGNLQRAIQISDLEYDLVLSTDVNSRGHTQVSHALRPFLCFMLMLFITFFFFSFGGVKWFYFSVSNMVAGVRYKFNIVNMEKCSSVFSHGMKPCVCHVPFIWSTTTLQEMDE